MKKLIMGMMLLTSMSSFAAGIQCDIPEYVSVRVMQQIEQPDGSLIRTVNGEPFAGAMYPGDETTVTCSYEVVNANDISKIHTCVLDAQKDGVKVIDQITIHSDNSLSMSVTIDSTKGLEQGTVPTINPETGEPVKPIETIDTTGEGLSEHCFVIE